MSKLPGSFGVHIIIGRAFGSMASKVRTPFNRIISLRSPLLKVVFLCSPGGGDPKKFFLLPVSHSCVADSSRFLIEHMVLSGFGMIEVERSEGLWRKIRQRLEANMQAKQLGLKLFGAQVGRSTSPQLPPNRYRTLLKKKKLKKSVKHRVFVIWRNKAKT